MKSRQSQWQEVKDNYLRQIKEKLSLLEHPRCAEILRDVEDHLDNKYAELPADRKTWEAYQEILIQMGPPADYAALLCDDIRAQNKFKFGLDKIVLIVGGITILLVGLYLTTQDRKSNTTTAPQPAPVVQSPTQTSPQPAGPINTPDTKKEPVKQSAETLVAQQPQTPAETISQPVIPLPDKLSDPNQDSAKTTTLTFIQPTSQVLGKWISVDYVKAISDFVPNQKSWKKPLLLRELNFTAPETLYWGFENKVVKRTTFKQSTAQTINGYSATFVIKTIDAQDYLFIEWMTLGVVQQGQSPWYYVLLKAKDQNAALSQHPGMLPAAGNASLVGTWFSVDYVEQPQDFIPGRKSWNGGDLYLKKMVFRQDGSTEGPWRWTKEDIYHPGDKSHAKYQIRQIEGQTYLFFEWMSGDVMLRGQTPWYYVLKKEDHPG